MADTSINSSFFNILRVIGGPFAFFVRCPFMCQCAVRISRGTTGDYSDVSARVNGLFCVFSFPVILRGRVLRAFDVNASEVRRANRL